MRGETKHHAGEIKKLPRLADVAALAGVSPGLVSRIINADSNLKVREETREKVLSAIDMLQYSPHAAARALRSSQTGLLGFALHHVNDPIYAQMVETAQAAAAESNYSVVLLNTDELLGRSEAFRELVRGRRVDGLLIQSGFAANSQPLVELAQSLPSLVFNATATPELRTLRLEDDLAARIATEHLIELGHTRIAFVGAEGDSSLRRHQGYVAAMSHAGLAPHPLIIGGWDAGDTREAITQYFSSGGQATALVVVTTTSALGVHAGTIASGRSIPEDVSVISLHDTLFAPHLTPALTVVALPLKELGRLAVELLIEQTRSARTGETVLSTPAPRIIQRGSTAPPTRPAH